MDYKDASRPTRDRVVTEALRLFSERGYRGTRVQDIEAAAGLSPGAGGFYRHFRSKRDVLEAAFQHYEREAIRNDAALQLLPLADIRSELTLMCRWALNTLADQRDFIRLILREGNEFPELVAEFHQSIVQRGFILATEFFRFKQKQAGVDVADQDPEAIAALALGSIINYRVEEALFGAPPLGVSEERFVQSWVELWISYGDHLVRAASAEQA